MAYLKFWRNNRRDMKWRISVQPIIPYRFEDNFVMNVNHKSACSVSCRNALREDRNGDFKSVPLRFTVSKTAEVILKEFAWQIACFFGMGPEPSESLGSSVSEVSGSCT